jgi:hypothetical protein
MVPLRVRVAGRAVGSGFHSAQLFASIDDGCGELRRRLATASPRGVYEMTRPKKRRVSCAAETSANVLVAP